MILRSFDYKAIWWTPIALAVVLAAALLLPGAGAVRAADAKPEPVLIIDAGHGGADGGAVAKDGTEEAGVNLDVALRLNALAAFWGVPTVMTRSAADIAYPADAATIGAMKRADQYARAALINATPGAVLLSIHQNNYPAPSPSGPQVFFGRGEGSEAFAAVVQGNLTACLCPDNRRVASPVDDSVFLMRKAGCTAALAECGFLSNPGELEKLKTPAYRTQLAVIFLASYLQYIRGIQT